MIENNEETPAQLVTRIGLGDASAEMALIRRFSRGVLAMLRQRTSDWELAADLHQDTFVVVIEKLRARQIDHPDRVSAFIRQTAINLHIAELRKLRRRNTSPDSDRIAEAADAGAGPVARLERGERHRLLQGLIGELRQPRDREVLLRFYLGEESKSDICRDLELDAAHFDRVLFRARQRLKSLIDNTAVPDLAGQELS